MVLIHNRSLGSMRYDYLVINAQNGGDVFKVFDHFSCDRSKNHENSNMLPTAGNFHILINCEKTQNVNFFREFKPNLELIISRYLTDFKHAQSRDFCKSSIACRCQTLNDGIRYTAQQLHTHNGRSRWPLLFFIHQGSLILIINIASWSKVSIVNKVCVKAITVISVRDKIKIMIINHIYPYSMIINHGHKHVQCILCPCHKLKYSHLILVYLRS